MPASTANQEASEHYPVLPLKCLQETAEQPITTQARKLHLQRQIYGLIPLYRIIPNWGPSASGNIFIESVFDDLQCKPLEEIDLEELEVLAQCLYKRVMAYDAALEAMEDLGLDAPRELPTLTDREKKLYRESGEVWGSMVACGRPAFWWVPALLLVVALFRTPYGTVEELGLRLERFRMWARMPGRGKEKTLSRL
ncbi:hypothetical protein BJ508DRAFT_325897 [Ascobolus immersus RN42]|uniref:Uncharacterized protein n=1 Tax=Ascobolus immersus RN42 TaxID=1160509 RepID=A0A3N4I7T1_ASCIM|nr:hypothetical protein BJ508DRAFT_325897 [Ascobolus immersus RN42]